MKNFNTISFSYEQEFKNIFRDLDAKYPEALFYLDGIGKQLDLAGFSRNFFKTGNDTATSDVSVDSNANISDKSIISYNYEWGKPLERFNSYYLLWKEMRKIYSADEAKKAIEANIIGDIYVNDQHGISGGKYYCFNYSTYDVMLKGLPFVTKIKSYPPKYLYGFKSQLEQFLIIAGGSSLGATGVADLLAVWSLYAENILDNLADGHFKFASKEDCWSYVRESLISLIYTLNQPLRANQSLFSNVSVFDKYFIESIVGSYVHPITGKLLNADILMKIQEMYLDIMNEEMHRTPITFPVTTACMSIDENNEIVDKDFLDMVSKKDLEFGFINFYTGKTSTLSSCCLAGYQNVVYETSEGQFVGEISAAVNNQIVNKSKIFKIYYNGGMRNAKPVKIPFYGKKMFHVETVGGICLDVTNDHFNPTKNGDKLTTNLTTDDCLKIENKIFCYDKIKSIEEVEYDDSFVYCFEMEDKSAPYFTLANGIVTHNCRLRSEMQTEYFNSFGSGGTKIGSLSVATINLPRIAFKAKGNEKKFFKDLEEKVNLCFKVNYVRRKLIQQKIDEGFHPLYTHGFVSTKTQYSTCGVNGFNEAIEIMGKNPLEQDGIDFGLKLIGEINKTNDALGRHFSVPVNCEQIPAENVSVKLAEKDKLMGYNNKYPIYSNQFIPLTSEADLLDRIRLQGIYDSKFSGGAIAHLNVGQKIEDYKQVRALIEKSAKAGVVYFAINYVVLELEDGSMVVGSRETTEVGGKKVVNYFTRVVGFMVNVKHFSKERREVDFPNRKFYKSI
jgi:anaerobic ribonucleoside-triphosphate reductase